MIIELIIALLLGCTIGTFTGIMPGIHINLVSALLLAHISYFSFLNPLALVIFISSMAITHTFIDFIPSVFLGAPEEDTFLSVLPGHQLLKEGKGHDAVVLTLYGSISAIPVILIMTPVFIFILPGLFELIKKIVPYILIFASLYIIFREENFLLGIIVFLMSGFLGLAALNLPINEPLLPLLAGLFGSSAIAISLKEKSSLPKQIISKIRNIKLPKKDFLKSLSAASISAPLCSFLPGIGSGHAAIIGSELTEIKSKGTEQNPRQFLFLVGAINTIVMGLGFVTAYSIGKTRTGASAAVKEILSNISLSNLIAILLVVVFAGLISFVIGVCISKFFAANIGRINYKKLNILVLIILTSSVFYFSGWLGLLVFVTATSLGIFAIQSGSRRINMMGVLLIPTIVFYLIS